MKIEKLSENQIRCTLTQKDLNDRHLKLSELAYGTEKAQMLFQDMMKQANYEFGFEAEDIPLMIEAIPVSKESIILLITKVEYPEELDTRFSRFSNMDEEYEFTEAEKEYFSERADDIIGLFAEMAKEQLQQSKENESKEFIPLKDTLSETKPVSSKDLNTSPVVPADITRLFVFHKLEDITRLAHTVKGFYDGENTLYKDSRKHCYYLVLHKSNSSPEVFNKLCNILSEYAHQQNMTSATEAYFTEHLTMICKNNALQTFSAL